MTLLLPARAGRTFRLAASPLCRMYGCFGWHSHNCPANRLRVERVEPPPQPRAPEPYYDVDGAWGEFRRRCDALERERERAGYYDVYPIYGNSHPTRKAR